MEFLDENLVQYIEKSTQDEPELLQKLNRETHQKVTGARMLSGHLQGRILSLFSKLVRPKNILEVGTYTGYSALCMAEGLQKGGKLHTIDKNKELYDLERRYFDASDYGEQIVQHTGDAREIIPQLDEQFDLAFIDADKANYAKYYESILPKMPSGGMIISDNVLWSGKVLKPAEPKDKDTKTLQEYSQMLKNDERVETYLLPIRDGLMVTRKNETE